MAWRQRVLNAISELDHPLKKAKNSWSGTLIPIQATCLNQFPGLTPSPPRVAISVARGVNISHPSVYKSAQSAAVFSAAHSLFGSLSHRVIGGTVRRTTGWVISCLQRVSEELGGALYPPYCSVCSVGTTPKVHLCGLCAAGASRLRWEPETGCAQCSRAFTRAIVLGPTANATNAADHSNPSNPSKPAPWARCADCCARAPAFSHAVVPYRANGVVREVIHGFKYQTKKHLLGVLGAWLAEGLWDPRLRDPAPEVLVPVPLHWWRLRRRGFNQAELLARYLVSECNGLQKETKSQTLGLSPLKIGLRVECLLERHRDTGTQTVLDRAARLQNLRSAFRLRAQAQVTGLHVVLVDDVLTTGATLDACAQVLRAAGAASVRALAVARG